jgi:citrate synthase
MNDPALLARVKDVLAQEWKVDVNAIPNDAALNRYPAWDSLGHITILLALQSRFTLELTADTVQALISIPRIVDHLATQSAARAEQPALPAV